jgi:hypothetical protein
MNNKERIAKLEARVGRIEVQIKTLREEIGCPLCGSRTTHSTLYPRSFCRMEYGYCGFLMLHKQGFNTSKDPKPYFHRTSWLDDTKEIWMPQPIEEPEVEIYFIAGRQVPKEQYLYKVE